MLINTLLRKGEEHKIFCQDFLYHRQIAGWIIAAVFDGCSQNGNEEMENESQFISNLSAKIINRVGPALIVSDMSRKDPAVLSYDIIKSYFLYLKDIRNKLDLTEDEMLTTMILLVYNKELNIGHIIALGDGFVKINGEVKEIENGKITDTNKEGGVLYPIQYLDTVLMNDKTFDEFVYKHADQWIIDNIEDVVISTDGINKQWKNFNSKNDFKFTPEEYLATDTQLKGLNKMLARKYNQLILNGWHNGDDIGMIRIFKGEGKEKESTDIKLVENTQ